MIKTFLEKLHQRSLNNQKAQKFVPVLGENLSVKNAPKLSAKYLVDKICKIKQIQNIQVTLRIFLNQLNFFLKKLSPKEDSSKTTISKVLSRILYRNKISKQQYNFSKDMISLEVHDMQQKAKFLKERKFQGKNTTFIRLRFLQKFMACSEVLAPKINWNPPGAKFFKPILILKIYIQPLSRKPSPPPPWPQNVLTYLT